MTKREIRATYDSEGIYVYQAYNPQIAAAAMAKGTFAEGFKMERMTWIKPSLGWMLYRSEYGTKPNQEAVLRIKITHKGFIEALRNSALSDYHPKVHGSRKAWKQALKESPVRVQWDPDRDLRLNKLERRAIQIGLSGAMVPSYVYDWIIDIKDITPLAHAIRDAVRVGTPLPQVPEERIYEVERDIRHKLGMENVP